MHRTSLLVAALLAAGCTTTGGATTTTTVPTTTTSEVTTTSEAPTTTTTEVPATTRPPVAVDAALYFLMHPASGESGPFLVPVARETQTGRPADAVAALIAGPTTAEQALGVSSAIPSSIELLGLDVADGIASVDLSGDFDDTAGSYDAISRLGQLTWTLTRFDGIDAVLLLLDGEVVELFSEEGLEITDPITRDAFLELRPAILVESPLFGGEVEAELAVDGIASVFEATVSYEVERDGEIVAEGFFTALDAPPNWGTFSGTIDVGDAAPVAGADYDLVLRVWSDDAEDGGRDWVMEYPLRLAG